MDYKEEQANEVEALESIYCGEMEKLGSNPHRFCIQIKADFDKDKEEGLTCTIKFTLTEKYPDELPLMELIEHQHFTKTDKRELMEFLIDQAQQSLGMVMVYTLVSAAQEWLSTRWDLIKKNRELEAEKRKKEEEEEEMKKFEGTRVTVESFMRWREEYEDEMGLNKRELKEEKDGRKLTGKELFMQDHSLAESDLRYLEEVGDGIKVEESLFADLDDLEIKEDTEESDN